MKILKQGKQNSKLRKFTCKHCGCEFVCKQNECVGMTTGLVTIYFSVCPCCGFRLDTVWKRGEEYIEED